MQIINDAQLLAQVEAFLKRTRMAASTFGREAMSDGALVSQLRAGRRSLTLKNAERVVAFMEAYRPTSKAA